MGLRGKHTFEHTVANIVNDGMNRLKVGSSPAIARDDDLLLHTLEIAQRMVKRRSPDDNIDIRSVENDILLAEANQAELLSDYGVLRRQAFRRQLMSHMERMSRDPNLQAGGVVLIMTDGNGLKTINDKVSHYYGDRFVKVWADQLTRNLRQGEGDIFFQHGSGDELAGMITVKSKVLAEKVMGGDKLGKEQGRLQKIKEGILVERQSLIDEIGSFPKSRKKVYGTLAIGWDWVSNRDLLAMYAACNKNVDTMIGKMYKVAEERMKIDKGNNTR
jgi:GGDEF domain-containing protein